MERHKRRWSVIRKGSRCELIAGVSCILDEPLACCLGGHRLLVKLLVVQGG